MLRRSGGSPRDGSLLRRLWRILCLLLCGVFALFGVSALITTITKGHLAKGDTTGSAIVATVFFWLLAALFLWLWSRGRAGGRVGLGVRLLGLLPFGRHRLAGGMPATGDGPPHPQAMRAVLEALGDSPARSSHARALIKRSEREYARWQRNPAAWRRRQRLNQVTGWTLLIVGIPAAAAVFTVGAIERHEAWSRSSYTQAHGRMLVATVRRSVVSQNCGRHSCSQSTTLTVTLRPAVDGTTTAYVHTPSDFRVPSGTALPVLIDPQEPSYGEFPGQQAHSAFDWIAWSVMGLLMDLSALLVLGGGLLTLRQRRRRRGRPPSFGRSAAIR